MVAFTIFFFFSVKTETIALAYFDIFEKIDNFYFQNRIVETEYMIDQISVVENNQFE